MKSLIIDTHLDLTFDLVRRSSKNSFKLLDNEYYDDFKKGNVGAVVSAIYIDDEYLLEKAFDRALNHIEALENEVKDSTHFVICTSIKQLQAANNLGKIALLISLEGLEPIGTDIEKIDTFYKRGVRMMSLTWSRNNLVASGSSFKMNNLEEMGLTEFGFNVLKRISELKIVLDVSHINEEGFWDIVKAYKKPIIASHSNCRAIRDIPRNLSDQQIIAIKESGGFIGINASSVLLSEVDGDVDVKKYVDHIDHVVTLAGINHVGFGFDFCNKIMCYFDSNILNMLDRVPFDCIEGHGEIDLIIEELKIRKYSISDIEKIVYKNFIRIIEQVID